MVKLPSTLTEIELDYFSVSNNHIASLPNFSQNENNNKIQVFDLSHNLLTKIENETFKNVKIDVLSLSNNKIHQISVLPLNVKKILLGSNNLSSQIQQLEYFSQNHPSLSYMDLSNNFLIGTFDLGNQNSFINFENNQNLKYNLIFYYFNIFYKILYSK